MKNGMEIIIFNSINKHQQIFPKDGGSSIGYAKLKRKSPVCFTNGFLYAIWQYETSSKL